MRRREGIELEAGLINPEDRRVWRQIEAVVPVGIEYLRHESDVGQPRRDATETRLPLIAAPQMNEGALVIELFQVQGDAHAERRGRAKIAVQFHDAPDRPIFAVSGAKLLRRRPGRKAAPDGLVCPGRLTGAIRRALIGTWNPRFVEP